MSRCNCDTVKANGTHAVECAVNSLPPEPAEHVVARDAIREAVKSWFDDSFDDEMLAQMEKHGIIAQALGFAISCKVTLQLEIETALGVQKKWDVPD